MKKKLLTAIVFVIAIAVILISNQTQYAISVLPTPIYNTADFAKAYDIVNNELTAKDKSGLVREIEGQTFPGTVWKIHDTINMNGITIYEASTNEYWNVPKDFHFFIDSRSVDLVNKRPGPRQAILPPKSYMLDKMQSIKAQTEKELIPYIWGGNVLEGIPENKEFYAGENNLSKLSSEDKKQFFLEGLDCTGLLYYITNGHTPRNSSWLRTFGDPVNIENKNIDEIIAIVKPLDIVVHQGHVFMILDKDNTIESRLSKGGGVVIIPIKERFKELMAEKYPINKAPQNKSENSWFVIRRFTK